MNTPSGFDADNNTMLSLVDSLIEPIVLVPTDQIQDRATRYAAVVSQLDQFEVAIRAFKNYYIISYCDRENQLAGLETPEFTGTIIEIDSKGLEHKYAAPLILEEVA